MRGKHSTVLLFLRGLPADVSSRELKSFLRTTLIASGLKTRTIFSECLGDCNILRTTDRESGLIEFHGLIEIRPAAIALQAIDILNKTEFRGSLLKTHRYRHRSPLEHSQRKTSTTDVVTQGNSQTEGLRRPSLKIDLVVEPRATSLLTFRGLRTSHKLAGR